MYLCANCKPLKAFQMNVRGDGNCPKHGRFWFGSTTLKEKCSGCAKEKGVCQRCGNRIENSKKEPNAN